MFACHAGKKKLMTLMKRINDPFRFAIPNRWRTSCLSFQVLIGYM